MNYSNMTAAELLQVAANSDNALALALVNAVEQVENESDEQLREIKEALSEMVTERLEEIEVGIKTECEKDGYEYNAILEAVADECLTAEIGAYRDNFERHCLESASTTPHYIDHTTYHIDQRLALYLEKFSDDEWEKLADKACEDTETAFDDRYHQGYFADSKPVFYSLSFGELEREIDKTDFPQYVQDNWSELSPDIEDAIYVDMTDCNIELFINLEWLEKSIGEIALAENIKRAMRQALDGETVEIFKGCYLQNGETLAEANDSYSDAAADECWLVCNNGHVQPVDPDDLEDLATETDAPTWLGRTL